MLNVEEEKLESLCSRLIGPAIPTALQKQQWITKKFWREDNLIPAECNILGTKNP
jgi:hypothetical protein